MENDIRGIIEEKLDALCRYETDDGISNDFFKLALLYELHRLADHIELDGIYLTGCEDAIDVHIKP